MSPHPQTLKTASLSRMLYVQNYGEKVNAEYFNSQKTNLNPYLDSCRIDWILLQNFHELDKLEIG